jgi:hypothetical protein
MTNDESAAAIIDGKYELENINTFKVGAEGFIKFDFKPANTFIQNYKPSFNKSTCLNQNFLNTNTLTKSAYVIANLGTDVLAAYEISRMKWDKSKHFLASYVIANVTSGGLQLLLPEDTPNRKLKIFLNGVLASALIGVGKEYADYKGFGHVNIKGGSLVFSPGTVEANDALATFLGGIHGSFTFSILNLKKKNTHKKSIPDF